MPIQLTEQHFARRLAYLASLPLPDNVVKDAIGRFVENNGFSHARRPASGASPARHGAALMTGIKTAVLEVIPRIDGEFTYREIERGFEAIKYELEAKNPASSIGRVLRGLTKEGAIALVKKGMAGEPSVFKRRSAH